MAVLARRRTSQDVGNILGALYLAMLFLGIINSRTVQPPASYERTVRPLLSMANWNVLARTLTMRLFSMQTTLSSNTVHCTC